MSLIKFKDLNLNLNWDQKQIVRIINHTEKEKRNKLEPSIVHISFSITLDNPYGCAT
jgi:hypothetical protein